MVELLVDGRAQILRYRNGFGGAADASKDLVAPMTHGRRHCVQARVICIYGARGSAWDDVCAGSTAC
jgi:hypothetical protein